MFPNRLIDKFRKELQMIGVRKVFIRLNYDNDILYLDTEKIEAKSMANAEIYLHKNYRVLTEKEVWEIVKKYGIKEICLTYVPELGCQKVYDLKKNTEDNNYLKFTNPKLKKTTTFIRKTKRLKYYDILFNESILMPINSNATRLYPFYIEVKAENKAKQERDLKLLAVFTDQDAYDTYLKKNEKIEKFSPILIDFKTILSNKKYREDYDGFYVNPETEDCSVILVKDSIKILEKRKKHGD